MRLIKINQFGSIPQICLLILLIFFFVPVVAICSDDTTDYADLAEYTPDGWSDSIIISHSTGTTTSDDYYTDDQDIYVDFAFTNSGDLDIDETFYVSLYLDGEYVNKWTIESLATNDYCWSEDYNIGTLDGGEHEIEIVLDSTDVVDEDDEDNNTYNLSFEINQNLQVGDLVYRAGSDGAMYGCTEDLPYRLKFKNLLFNFNTGHVGIYIGDNEVVHAVKAGVEELTLDEFKEGYAYYGAKSLTETLTETQRTSISEYVRDKVNNSLYSFWGYLVTCLNQEDPPTENGILIQKGPIFYTCVGLAEAAYEAQGLDIVPDEEENTTIISSLPVCGEEEVDIFFPYTQYSSENLEFTEEGDFSCSNSKSRINEEESGFDLEAYVLNIQQDALEVLLNKKNPYEARKMAFDYLTVNEQHDQDVLSSIFTNEEEPAALRISALQQLDDTKPSDLLNAMSSAMENTSNQNLKIAIVRKIGSLEASLAVPEIISYLYDDSRHVRYEAAKVAANFESTSLIAPLLNRFAEDEDKIVRASAGIALKAYLTDEETANKVHGALEKETSQYVLQKVKSAFEDF